MKFLNFGSLNLDFVYHVENFVRPKETVSALACDINCGGKGLNQSIALANAGAEVYHAGKIGPDGKMLKDRLEKAGVYTDDVLVSETVRTGHAMIQVNGQGQNCIVLYGGANQCIFKEEIKNVLAHFGKDDWLLLQNEINNIGYIMEYAKERGMRIAFNPAPMNSKVPDYPLSLVDIFILNEVEGEGLSGEKEPDRILDVLIARYENAAVLLTLGAKGVRYAKREKRCCQSADPTVKVVDTTAAGDTFTGFFLARYAAGDSVEKALETACRACDFCVGISGAADSIPLLNTL